MKVILVERLVDGVVDDESIEDAKRVGCFTV